MYMRESSVYWKRWESKPERTNISWLTFFVGMCCVNNNKFNIPENAENPIKSRH